MYENICAGIVYTVYYEKTERIYTKISFKNESKDS